ncbi:serine/threonine-protein kinase [Catellatospora tritici]|uniref:serine/threonine-protein kinase n=1 Tax=Catellatospora tritici TaxID=2851566 RepID=UPI001C2D844D|nr:serine/threonine-protein kinase [Catellatospora tritici]MBV1853851.1 serine/threonine protein kinase [Catellatospora tritici]
MTTVLDQRYELLEQIGHGGMATVWRGLDLRLRRPVAIKALGAAMLQDPDMRQRFWREAQTIAALAHPAIVAVYDVSVDRDRAYVVMELVDGPSVARLLESGPLPVAQAVDIAAQTCAALAAAHAAGVVHRDITPGNLLLAESGALKVCDFGIAAWERDAYPALIAGTPGYIAPEQTQGGPIDARTDLYGLGCVLSAMITGAPPGPAGVPPHPAPPALADLISRLTAPDPADRPATAIEVAAELDRLRTGWSDATEVLAAAPTATRVLTALPPAGRAQVPVAGPATAVGPPAVVPPARRGGNRWLRPVLVAGGLVGAVTAVLLGLLLLQSAGQRAGVPFAGATSGAAPKSVVASPVAANRPDALLRSLVQEVDRLADSDALDDRAARDLRKKLSDLDKRLRKGEGEGREQAQDLIERLQDLRRDNRISAQGYDRLAELAGALVAALPRDSGDHD